MAVQDDLPSDRISHDLKDAVVRFWSTLHGAAFQVSEGRVLNRVLGMRVVQLTATGRRTGAPRTTMLTAPIIDGERIVLVASNGGDDRDPQWYSNILACPEVSILSDGTSRLMRARVAVGAERTELWRRIRSITPTYEHYQIRTTRQVPVVVLEPTAGEADRRGWSR